MQPSLAWVPSHEINRVRQEITDPITRATAFSALTRINTLYMVMRAGSGHLGSSFSAADIVSWAFLEEMQRPLAADGDLYFSSKGHDAPGLYAALIGLGGLDERFLHTLRRIGGLPGHPDVGTPHMPFNTGSLGMGISKAKGVILANRMSGRQQRLYVLTGDGELQEGQNYEALAGAVHRGMGELTVVVDHNKIQSDTWVSSVSDLGDVEARFAGFGWGVLRCDGHDFAALRDAFATRRERYPDLPAVIVADTVKGAGCTTFAATSMPPGEWRYRFHSGAPSAEAYLAAHAELVAHAEQVLADAAAGPLALTAGSPLNRPAPAGSPTFPQIYGEMLADLAETDDRVVAMDADLVLDTGLIPFHLRHPQRFVECGIAEQDMVSMAGGLAANGFVPFVHSFSCFLHSRPNEQIYNNATEGSKVVYVGSLAGLLPAAPGHSHQAVRDISAVGGVPGLYVLEPASPAQVRAATRFCLDTSHSVFLRLASVPCPPEVSQLPAPPLMPGRGDVLRSGGRTVAIGSGPVVLAQLLQAAEQLAAEGHDLTVVNLPWLNHVDPSWLGELAADDIIVVENHYTRGGQADVVARALCELGGALRPSFHGVGLTEVPRCGAPAEALRAHGLHAEQLAELIRARVPAHVPA